MNTNLIFSATLCLFLTVPFVASCDAPNAHSEPDSAARARPAAAETKPDSKSGSSGLVIEGEHFTRRVIDDPQQGMPVGVFVAPEKWKTKTRVVWNYAYVSNPVSLSTRAENPQNEEAFFGYPALRFFALRPDYGFMQPGQNSGGLIKADPIPPTQALLRFIRRTRADCPNLKIIGRKELPDLATALHASSSQYQTGIGIKVTYEWKGHPVEEEFYTLPYSVNIPYDGPQGRTWQVNWGSDYLHSFRAPVGELDKRRAVFAAIAKSFRVNPAWQQRLAGINRYLQDQFNRELQAGYDRIAAAAALSRQISANNDAMLAAIDRQLQASHTGEGASSTRSAADKFDDYIRGVDTMDDPYYGTSQHSSTEQYHWTDGYGSYRNSNDPSYNPNQHENGDWRLMEPAQ